MGGDESKIKEYFLLAKYEQTLHEKMFFPEQGFRSIMDYMEEFLDLTILKSCASV